MTTAKKRVEFVSVSLAIAIAFLLVVHADGAQAQAVGNGSFEVPNVSSDPGGFAQDGDPALTGPGVLWNFPSSPGGDSGITVGDRRGTPRRRTRRTAIRWRGSRISASSGRR